MTFRAIDYGVYVLFLTPQFVLISALAEPGTGDLGLSWLRAVNSILGGILALAAGTLLWPGRTVNLRRRNSILQFLNGLSCRKLRLVSATDAMAFAPSARDVHSRCW